MKSGEGWLSVELAAAGGLSHDPLRLGLAGIPAGVVDQVAEHVGHPTGGGSGNGVYAAEGAAGGDLLDLAVVDAVAVLVTDHGFDAGIIKQLLDFHAFAAGQGDGLFKSDQLGTALNAGFDQGSPEVGQGTETENIRFDLAGKGCGVGAGLGIAQLLGCGFQACRIDVAEAGDLETGIGMEGRGMVQPAFAHANHHDFVGFAHFLAFLKRKFSTLNAQLPRINLLERSALGVERLA